MKSADRVANVQQRLERIRGKALRMVRLAMEGVGDDEVKMAAKLPKGEAPMYLHMAAAIAADAARTEAAKGPPTTNNLNVIIMGQAPTAAAWLQQVQEVRNLPPAPAVAKVIDVEPAK